MKSDRFDALIVITCASCMVFSSPSLVEETSIVINPEMTCQAI